MRIVVDTNIVFSAIINGSGKIGDILFNSPNSFNFYSPEFMIDEISKYEPKLIKASKLPLQKFQESKQRVLSQIDLISEEVILQKNWEYAHQIMKDVDIYDTPFVALTLELNALLWTGDKKLINGINQLELDFCKTTEEILQIRGY